MTTSTQQNTVPSTVHPLDALRPGTWRHEVLDRVGRLEAELATFGYPGPTVAMVRSDLEAARQIATAHGWSWDAGSGRAIENAWRYLRLAEEGLAGLTRGQDRIEVLAARALGHAKGHLPADHVLTQDLTRALAAEPRQPGRLKELAEAVIVQAHEASTAQHHQQRSFRNQVRGLTLVLLLLAAACVAALLAVPAEQTTGLLPAPEGMTTQVAAPLAMFLGSMGALFSALPSLSQLASQSSPFNPVKEQAALKVVVGAWSAVVGLLVVQAGMSGVGAEAPATASTVAGFAVMAALFGASQEAITRFADHKAGQVAPSTT